MSSAFKTRLLEERSFLRHQFPMITPMNDPPTTYTGYCRCEKGPVKELADKAVWPFTEYVQMHQFRLELPEEYPLKPPIATWMTEISHPNIVPFLRGVVCVSILGKHWKDDLKLPVVIDSLFYLLADPNPNDVWNHPKCLKSAEVCRKHGFPRKGQPTKPPSDIVRFNIVELPKPAPGDVVRFSIPNRRKVEK